MTKTEIAREKFFDWAKNLWILWLLIVALVSALFGLGWHSRDISFRVKLLEEKNNILEARIINFEIKDDQHQNEVITLLRKIEKDFSILTNAQTRSATKIENIEKSVDRLMK